jgi:hypothetical protein
MYEINWMYLYLQAWIPIHGMEELCPYGCCTDAQSGFWDTWNYMWEEPEEVFSLLTKPELKVSRR